MVSTVDFPRNDLKSGTHLEKKVTGDAFLLLMGSAYKWFSELIPPSHFLDDLLLSNKYVLKLPIWRISSGHRNGQLSQTWEAGKHNEVDLIITAILYFSALFSSHFNPNTYVHNFQNVYAWIFTVDINKMNEIKNIHKERKKIKNAKKT